MMEPEFYYLSYSIHRKANKRYFATLRLYDPETRRCIKQYRPSANKFFIERTAATNYALMRIRHHREDKPCKFIGELLFAGLYLPTEIEVLYILKKRDEEKRN